MVLYLLPRDLPLIPSAFESFWLVLVLLLVVNLVMLGFVVVDFVVVDFVVVDFVVVDFVVVGLATTVIGRIAVFLALVLGLDFGYPLGSMASGLVV